MELCVNLGAMAVRVESDVGFGTLEWWLYAGASLFLVLFGGIMSGLTLGLMSLTPVDLEVLIRSGDEDEKRQAGAIFPVVEKPHQLLVTLLLCNALAMEALPIFLDRIFNPFVAVALSVTFVLLFGEIIPQAICSRYGLAVGASMVGLMRVLLLVCWPIAFPIGKLLDSLLGHEDHLLERDELKALVSLHSLEEGRGGQLTHDEAMIISGALDLVEKTAEEAMTPIESTFCLPITACLDLDTMKQILAKGHSRVPIYKGQPNRIVGVLLVKNLITVRPEDEVPIFTVALRRIPRFAADLPLYTVLNQFQEGSSHIAVVVRRRLHRVEQAPPTSVIHGDASLAYTDSDAFLGNEGEITFSAAVAPHATVSLSSGQWTPVLGQISNKGVPKSPRAGDVTGAGAGPPPPRSPRGPPTAPKLLPAPGLEDLEGGITFTAQEPKTKRARKKQASGTAGYASGAAGGAGAGRGLSAAGAAVGTAGAAGAAPPQVVAWAPGPAKSMEEATAAAAAAAGAGGRAAPGLGRERQKQGQGAASAIAIAGQGGEPLPASLVAHMQLQKSVVPGLGAHHALNHGGIPPPWHSPPKGKDTQAPGVALWTPTEHEASVILAEIDTHRGQEGALAGDLGTCRVQGRGRADGAPGVEEGRHRWEEGETEAEGPSEGGLLEQLHRTSSDFNPEGVGPSGVEEALGQRRSMDETREEQHARDAEGREGMTAAMTWRWEGGQWVLETEEEEVIGIITMEDVIEELLQEEIVDETDEFIDVHKKIKVARRVGLMLPRRGGSKMQLHQNRLRVLAGNEVGGPAVSATAAGGASTKAEHNKSKSFKRSLTQPLLGAKD